MRCPQHSAVKMHTTSACDKCELCAAQPAAVRASAAWKLLPEQMPCMAATQLLQRYNSHAFWALRRQALATYTLHITDAVNTERCPLAKPLPYSSACGSALLRQLLLPNWHMCIVQQQHTHQTPALPQRQQHCCSCGQQTTRPFTYHNGNCPAKLSESVLSIIRSDVVTLL